MELSWGWDDGGDALQMLGPASEREVVLLSDCIYWESLYAKLICTLIRYLFRHLQRHSFPHA